MTVGDQTVESSITRENNAVTIHAGGVTMGVSSIDNGSGQTAPLDDQGNVVLDPGAKVRVNVAGFMPDSSVDAWMFSTPYHLGTAQVDSTGTLTTDFTVPTDIEHGRHRIAIEATLPDGKKTTVALAVSVGGYGRESNIGTWLIVTPIVLAVLVALFIPAARRRKAVPQQA